MCYVYRKCNPITLPWEKETTTILAYVSKWEQEGMLLIYLIDVAANMDNYVISPYNNIMCVLVCVCVCVHDNSKNNGSIHLKLEHIVVYENRALDIVRSRSRSQCDFEIFLHLPQYKLSSPISQL